MDKAYLNCHVKLGEESYIIVYVDVEKQRYTYKNIRTHRCYHVSEKEHNQYLNNKNFVFTLSAENIDDIWE